MRFLFPPHVLLLVLPAIAIGSLAPLPAQEAPLVFDFGTGTLPEGSRFQSERTIAGRRTNEVSFSAETFRGRKIQAALLGESAQGKDGFRLVLPTDDSLYGKLDALTISLVVRVDAAAPAPIFFHRLRGSHSAAGYFSFMGTRKDEGGPLRLGFRVTTEGGGETMTATEALDVPEDEWIQLAVVYTGEEARFYANGEILGVPVPTYAGEIPAMDPDRCDLSIYAFKGGISEVVIAPNQAFSEEQIKSLFENGLEGVDGFSAAK